MVPGDDRVVLGFWEKGAERVRWMSRHDMDAYLRVLEVIGVVKEEGIDPELLPRDGCWMTLEGEIVDPPEYWEDIRRADLVESREMDVFAGRVQKGRRPGVSGDG